MQSENDSFLCPAFRVPASTFRRLQKAAAANGWKIGHMVETALEAYLDNPTAPTAIAPRRPVGRPRKDRSQAAAGAA
jgi:hypothetical protein